MPTQLAHDALSLALNYTEKTVDWTKSKPGLVKSIVERVEKPVTATLGSRAAKTVLKVGDSVLTSVDAHLDNALNSRYYKGGEAFVKSTYSNRIVPATNTVTSTVTTTTTRVTTPVLNVYSSALTFADRQVEYYIPDPEGSDRHAPLSLTSVTAKATRRAVKKAGAARTGVVMRVKRANRTVRNVVAMAFEQARPTNIKKNAKAAYTTALSETDKVIDRYLPGAKDDGLIVKGPVTLVTKLTKRTTKHTIATVKAAALAIRNSPTTFKRAVHGAVTAVRVQAARIANMGLTIRYRAYDTLTPYLNAATTRAVAVARATDGFLLRRPATASLRNFAVTRYNDMLAPIVSKYLPKLVAVAPAPKDKPVVAKLSFAGMTTEAKAEESPLSVESDTSDVATPEAAEQQDEGAQVPKKKSSKKGRGRKKAELAAPAAEKDEDAYC
mmetsp:Transcript_38160/g.74574  ORF Transcript_38160/g.74574 Transcript_38160/m.74574 type:complete len:440 (-) Transcript_38160:111-1430(-)|eukprot:CAMPEP_0173388970 /NCGR_PEP_ID=MMETSP1356-20130122/11149_1 /TAXON_ID=77927 ORGANISM="Hemiselmis virescens, Strain PCC157" /NCGR_SAMPLE_ID=MMETSP1356 /ASSEMBLY_ACC=CAM_ASM_000847 /LENGTH=439 /DNA_ID=CAMNT_0014345995 /DNA_START=109 /DNA_END=1428 /DNA_ORIENTATION=+